MLFSLPTFTFKRNFMKTAFTAVLMLATTLAFATPKVGDTAKYKGTAQGMSFEMEVKLTAYDAASDTFTKVTTTSVMGQTDSEAETVLTDDLATDQQLQAIVTYCEVPEIGGKKEKVVVAAGTFNTCKISQEGADINMAVVPFGIVKLKNEEIALELISFKKN